MLVSSSFSHIVLTLSATIAFSECRPILCKEYKIFSVEINFVGGLARVETKLNTQVKVAIKNCEERPGGDGSTLGTSK